MRPQSLGSRLLALAIVGAVAALAACAKNEPQVFISVRVASNGEHTVNGKAVTEASLEAALSPLKPEHGRFAIGFQVAASAPYQSVQHAMSVAQRLGATVGIVGNEKF
jgi:biopolymer transport protein ExbD